jgi:hypothetical protein
MSDADARVAGVSDVGVPDSSPWSARHLPERASPSMIDNHIKHLGFSVEDLSAMVRLSPREFEGLYGAFTTADPTKPRLRIVK